MSFSEKVVHFIVPNYLEINFLKKQLSCKIIQFIRAGKCISVKSEIQASIPPSFLLPIQINFINL